tara:strand:- start:2374 stop:2541 length:168 start_codon:yes stop_codon:yes gene_type:complete
MKVGDLVTTDDSSQGPVGVVIGLTKRLYISAAEVLVGGEVVEFDIEELWRYYESR